MRTTLPLAVLGLLVAVPILSLAADPPPPAATPSSSTPQSALPTPHSFVGPKAGEPWRAIHLLMGGGSGLGTLEGQLPALAKLGVNIIIVEVDYNFDYKSAPELKSGGAITKAQAGRFSAAARQSGIRVVPMINCLDRKSVV
jgi:hypothetical protein